MARTLLLVGLMTLAIAGTAQAAPLAHASVTCDDYSNQRDAQINKDTRDADGDGIYCEANPCPCLRPGESAPAPTPKPAPKPKPVGPSPQQIAKQKAKDKARARARARARKRARDRARKRKLARDRRAFEGRRAQIVEVVDGDTVKVRLTKPGQRVTVRLVGVDTPETRKPATPVECGGPEATATLTAISFDRPASPYAMPPFPGKFVTIDTDETQDLKDRNGRVLAYLDTVDGGIDLGEVMVAAGWSEAYVLKRKPQRFGRYQAVAAAAETARRGVWGACGGDFHSES